MFLDKSVSDSEYTSERWILLICSAITATVNLAVVAANGP